MFCPEFALLNALNGLAVVLIGFANMLVGVMDPKRPEEGCQGSCVVVAKMFAGLGSYGFFGAIAKMLVAGC